MTSSLSYLHDLRPYKTSWRIQVKILHTWKQYTQQSGESFEMVLADERGTKIHASVRRYNVVRFVNQLTQGEWRFIENFSVTNAVGQFRPTNHFYKIGFINQTSVLRIEIMSDSEFLSFVKFSSIISGNLKQYHLIDVIGQIINIGELDIIESNNKPKKKLEFKLRDENDNWLACTVWGMFADQVFKVTQEAANIVVVCVLRFAKIQQYKDVISISNAFDCSQLRINPSIPEVDAFTRLLPHDGLALTFLKSKPRFQMVVKDDDDCLQYPMKTISELIDSIEAVKARIVCTIYAIDRDWGWYYFSHLKCNKKVTKVHNNGKDIVSIATKPKFWCDVCRANVTNVVPKFKLHLKVMDNSGQTKLLLFDSLAKEIVTQQVAVVLDGHFDEIDDPEVLPESINNLIGKTFQFCVFVDKENICDGLDTFKVYKVLSKHGMIKEDAAYESDSLLSQGIIVSFDQIGLIPEISEEPSTSTTPSCKRSSDDNNDLSDHSSTTKRLCLEAIELEDEKHGIAEESGDQKKKVMIKKVVSSRVNDVKIKIERNKK